jgi:hypothetical protein
VTPRPRAPWTLRLDSREVTVWVLPSDRTWTEVDFAPDIFDLSKPASTVRATRDLDGNWWLAWRTNTHGTRRPVWALDRPGWVRDDARVVTPFARQLGARVQSLHDDQVRDWVCQFLENRRTRVHAEIAAYGSPPGSTRHQDLASLDRRIHTAHMPPGAARDFAIRMADDFIGTPEELVETARGVAGPAGG